MIKQLVLAETNLAISVILLFEIFSRASEIDALCPLQLRSNGSLTLTWNTQKNPTYLYVIMMKEISFKL